MKASKTTPAPLTRRHFLKSSGTAVAGAWMGAMAMSKSSYARVLGANDRVQLGLIGCGGRGRGVTGSLIRRPDVVCTDICDLRDDRLSGTASSFARQQDGHPPRTTKSMAELLDRKDVDAVMIGTPDHWHTPAAILACQAGKDVYVEKPFSHNIWEGRKLVEASRRYKRIVQIGTQNRSGAYNLAAREYVQSGKLGDVRLVKVYNLKGGGRFSLGAPGTKPENFDWNAWLGAAPARPYHQRIFRGGWHHFWDYSGGDLADCGIHQLDLAMMVMGDPEPPDNVSTVGGRFQHKGDDSEVPDVEIIHYEFPNWILTFELSNYASAMSKIDGSIRNGDRFPHWPQCATRIEIYGSRDMMMLGRHGGGCQVFTSGGKVVQEQYGRHPDREHQENFVSCIKSRKLSNADVALAQKSTTIMHLGNISHRAGNQKLTFDPVKEKIIGNRKANRLVKRQNTNKYSVKDSV